MPMKPRPIMPSMPGSGTLVPPDVDDVVEPPVLPPEVLPPDVDDDVVLVDPPEDEVVVELVVDDEVELDPPELPHPPEDVEVPHPPEDVEVPHPPEEVEVPQPPPAKAGVAASRPARTVATVAMRFIGLPLSFGQVLAGLHDH
jgi:hypothetical protein